MGNAKYKMQNVKCQKRPFTGRGDGDEEAGDEMVA